MKKFTLSKKHGIFIKKVYYVKNNYKFLLSVQFSENLATLLV